MKKIYANLLMVGVFWLSIFLLQSLPTFADESITLLLSERSEGTSDYPKKYLVWSVTRDMTTASLVECRVFTKDDDDKIKFPPQGALLESLATVDFSQFGPGIGFSTADIWNNSTRIRPIVAQASYRMKCAWIENGQLKSTESVLVVAGGAQYRAAHGVDFDLSANRLRARLGKDLITVTYGGRTLAGERVTCFLKSSAKNAEGKEVASTLQGFELPENSERFSRTRQYDLEQHTLDLSLSCGSLPEKKLRLTRSIILKASKTHIIPNQGNAQGSDIAFTVSIQKLPKMNCKLLGGKSPVTISIPPYTSPDKKRKYTFTATINGVSFYNPISPVQVVCENASGTGHVESNVTEIYRLMSITAPQLQVEARTPLRLSWNAQVFESAERKIAPKECFLQSPVTAWDPAIVGMQKVSPQYSLTVFPPKKKTDYWLSCDYELTDKSTGQTRTDYFLTKQSITTFEPPSPNIEYLTEVGSILPEDIQKRPGVNQFFNFYVKGKAGVELLGDHRVCTEAFLLDGGTVPEADFTHRYMIQIETPDSPQTCKIRATKLTSSGKSTSVKTILPYLVDVRLPTTPLVWDIAVSPAGQLPSGQNRIVNFMIEGYSDFQNRENAEIIMAGSAGCNTYGKDVISLANQPVHTKKIQLTYQPFSSLSCSFRVRNISNGNQSGEVSFIIPVTAASSSGGAAVANVVTDSMLVGVLQYTTDTMGAIADGSDALLESNLITNSNPIIGNTAGGITTSNPLIAIESTITTNSPLVANTGAALTANSSDALIGNTAGGLTVLNARGRVEKSKQLKSKNKSSLALTIMPSRIEVGTTATVTIIRASPKTPIAFFLRNVKNTSRLSQQLVLPSEDGSLTVPLYFPSNAMLGTYFLEAVDANDVSGSTGIELIKRVQTSAEQDQSQTLQPVCQTRDSFSTILGKCVTEQPATSTPAYEPAENSITCRPEFTYSVTFGRCIENVPVTIEQNRPRCPASQEYSITLRQCVR